MSPGFLVEKGEVLQNVVIGFFKREQQEHSHSRHSRFAGAAKGLSMGQSSLPDLWLVISSVA